MRRTLIIVGVAFGVGLLIGLWTGSQWAGFSAGVGVGGVGVAGRREEAEVKLEMLEPDTDTSVEEAENDAQIETVDAVADSADRHDVGPDRISDLVDWADATR